MASRKRRQVKTIEVGRLRELHKLKISIKEKTKGNYKMFNECLYI